LLKTLAVDYDKERTDDSKEPFHQTLWITCKPINPFSFLLFSIAYRYRNFVDKGREERVNWGGGE